MVTYLAIMGFGHAYVMKDPNDTLATSTLSLHFHWHKVMEFILSLSNSKNNHLLWTPRVSDTGSYCNKRRLSTNIAPLEDLQRITRRSPECLQRPVTLRTQIASLPLGGTGVDCKV